MATIQTARYNKPQYLRDWKRLHHTLEQQAYPHFKRALDEQCKSVSNFITHHSVSQVSSHLSVLVTEQPIKTAYLSVYQRAGVSGATFTYNNIEKMVKGSKALELAQKDLPSFFSEKWRKLMSLFFHTQAADRVTSVTDTTKERIQQLLDEAQGMPISQQASYIQEQLDSPDFNRNRALVIARTETTTAANYGAQLGGQDSDYEVGKQWLAVLDANTRPDHADASGQLVDMGDTFTVGSSAMLYPGDMSAPANEVVNCRCSMAVVPLLSESGVPILKIR
jgi:hypothetical protein